MVGFGVHVPQDIVGFHVGLVLVFVQVKRDVKKIYDLFICFYCDLQTFVPEDFADVFLNYIYIYICVYIFYI